MMSLSRSLFHRKHRYYETKTLREDRTAAEMKMALERPVTELTDISRLWSLQRAPLFRLVLHCHNHRGK